MPNLITIKWQECLKHTLGWNFKSGGFVVFLHTVPYKQETKERGKIVRL